MMTASDLQRCGVSGTVLQRLCQKHEIVRASRGVYHLPDIEIDGSYDLAQAAKRFPSSVVCLLSAAAFHGLTDQNPADVWIALPARSWVPQVDDLPVKVVRWRSEAMQDGIEERMLCGVTVRVTEPARTVVDVCAARNRIGLDVFMEVLCAYIDAGNESSELRRHAQVLGLGDVMLPYLRMHQTTRSAPSPSF